MWIVRAVQSLSPLPSVTKMALGCRGTSGGERDPVEKEYLASVVKGLSHQHSWDRKFSAGCWWQSREVLPWLQALQLNQEGPYTLRQLRETCKDLGLGVRMWTRLCFPRLCMKDVRSCGPPCSGLQATPLMMTTHWVTAVFLWVLLHPKCKTDVGMLLVGGVHRQDR